MVDEHFDRLYREGGGELNSGIESGLRTLASQMMAAFQTLHRIKWEAPWAGKSRAKCN